ncbi:MAG TPA: FmdE family protein, partial [Methanothrix sp.]|nr:FmdE family protein [Methanothrix sp.]
NACFADGVQAVSGCTLGNNALVYRDLGRLAVTFAIRGRDTGVRVRVLPDFRDKVAEAAPEFYPLLERSSRIGQGTKTMLQPSERWAGWRPSPSSGFPLRSS